MHTYFFPHLFYCLKTKSTLDIRLHNAMRADVFVSMRVCVFVYVSDSKLVKNDIK